MFDPAAEVAARAHARGGYPKFIAFDSILDEVKTCALANGQKMLFGQIVESSAQEHALREYSKESCGFVIAGRYEPQTNIAADPENTFEIASSAFRADIQAVVHSHPAPRHSREPSTDDMRFQIEQRRPFGIVLTDGVDAANVLWWGDFRLDEPLEGREFIHGVTDCYAAIRAAFWQLRKIKIPDIPREVSWWSRPDAAFLTDGIAACGFVPIDASEAKPFDCVIFKSSDRRIPPHHTGVLLDEHRLLHHRVGDVSKVTLVNNLLPYIHGWYRFEGVAK